jgi:hypothetical protein
MTKAKIKRKQTNAEKDFKKVKQKVLIEALSVFLVPHLPL